MKESKPKYLEIADAIHQEIRQEIYSREINCPLSGSCRSALAQAE